MNMNVKEKNVDKYFFVFYYYIKIATMEKKKSFLN